MGVWVEDGVKEVLRPGYAGGGARETAVGGEGFPVWRWELVNSSFVLVCFGKMRCFVRNWNSEGDIAIKNWQHAKNGQSLNQMNEIEDEIIRRNEKQKSSLTCMK